MNEFSVISHYFDQQKIHRPDVVLGIGDDAAITNIPTGQQLVITTDTLVSGAHFPTQTQADDIGYKSLAVNLSDLAAMGATPAWITVALTLPAVEQNWLSGFSRGLFALASRYQVQLIGGDLTQGPLTITIQALGLIPSNSALTRKGAQVGDSIYVTNTIGDAGLALLLLNQEREVPAELLARLNRPEPRIRIGEALRGIANAAIDISDGLAADLGHILTQSRVGAILYVDQIPFSNTFHHTASPKKAIDLALNAGDDYELCFTVPKEKEHAMLDALNKHDCSCARIGMITDTKELDLQFSDGKKYDGSIQGYQHF